MARRARVAPSRMRIIIIDDEPEFRAQIARALSQEGHEVETAADSKEALQRLDEQLFDVALLDLNLGGEAGIELLPVIREQSAQVDVIVFTADASHEAAVEAIHLGAIDYIEKPFTVEQFRQALRRATDGRRLRKTLTDLEMRISSDLPPMNFETEDESMRKILEIARKAADSPASIMILGESGVGKSVLARFLHENSDRRDEAFVTVNCPSLSPELLSSELFGHVRGAFTGAVKDTWGKVAQGDGGTLFLDEIGELPLDIQPRLLRLLQEREYERVGEVKTRRANLRIIAATNRDLEREVEEGRFREDLFYRLNVINLTMPPLRERRRDTLRIAERYFPFFAAQCGRKISGFTDAAIQAMTSYEWPGNLRELRNAVERAVILAEGERISLDDLPAKVRNEDSSESASAQVGAWVTLEELERAHIERVVEQAETMEAAAETLGIDPATLYRKRKKYSL